MKTVAVVLAAGSGSRMKSDVKKQYMQIGGKPLIYYSLKAFEESIIDDIVLVVSRGDVDYVRNEIVDKYPNIPEDKLLHRALNQLARENLLLQSSDWPFLITTWQAKDYATDRFNEHVDRFSLIADMIESCSIDDGKLQEIESIDNCFPVIDYRVYQSITEGVIPQQEKKLAPLYS